jgi:hypothetical protein
MTGETEDTWGPSDEQEEGDRKTTAYIWDSMDADREDAMDILKQSDEWVIWKSKDKWTTLLKAAGFHQQTKKDIRMLGKKQDKDTTRTTGHRHNVTPITQSQLWQRRTCD